MKGHLCLKLVGDDGRISEVELLIRRFSIVVVGVEEHDVSEYRN